MIVGTQSSKAAEKELLSVIRAMVEPYEVRRRVKQIVQKMSFEF